MNKYLKDIMLQTIKTNHVEMKPDWGRTTYTVTNPANKPLMVVDNGWDYGIYSVEVNGKNALTVEWYENDKKPMTPDQEAVFEIIHACHSRIEEINAKKRQEVMLIEAQKKMSAQERDIAAFLIGKVVTK